MPDVLRTTRTLALSAATVLLAVAGGAGTAGAQNSGGEGTPTAAGARNEVAHAAGAARAAGVPDTLGAPAAGCERVLSRTTLAALSGARVRSVEVHTAAPVLPAFVPDALGKVHVRTRERTVRRQLLVVPGDTVDTLRVAESLRRLRKVRYLGDIALVGTRCRGDDGVALTVLTRDDWTTKPTVEMRSGGASVVGLSERNLLGTGRAASVYVRSDQGRTGIGASLNAPWELGGRATAAFFSNSYRDGSDWSAAIATRRRTIADPWLAGADVGALTRDATVAGGDVFRREWAHVTLGHRARVGASGVTEVTAGVEGERTALAAGTGAVIVGPSVVARDARMLALGVTQRAVRYDTLTWLLPSQAIVDVPLSVEGELVAAGGRDLAHDAGIVHLDGWLGRAWLPAPGGLLIGDLWAGGYVSRGRWSAASLRAAMELQGAARGGTWSARLVGERLFAPDPDVRSFTSVEPTTFVLPSRLRLADATTGLSLERSWRVRRLSRSWTLGVGALTAGSLRWEPAALDQEVLHTVVVGAGLRMLPGRATRGAARLDLLYPVAMNADGSRRPRIAISVSPAFGQSRHRDGQRGN